jgi:hypothetical protein
MRVGLERNALCPTRYPVAHYDLIETEIKIPNKELGDLALAADLQRGETL